MRHGIIVMQLQYQQFQHTWLCNIKYEHFLAYREYSVHGKAMVICTSVCVESAAMVNCLSIKTTTGKDATMSIMSSSHKKKWTL
jgi:hypothetical protein